MKTDHRLLRTAVATALLSLGLACGAQATTLKVSHVRPQGTAIDNDLRALAAEVDKATAGKLKLEIFPANALGDYTVVQERISVGAVDMACQPTGTAADRRMQIGVFPYLSNDWASARKAFGAGSVLRDTIESLYAKQDIRVLAAYPVYFGGIALNRDAVAPGDPDASKGIKLRVPPIKSFQLLANEIGYIGTPLPFSEAFTAVQTGVVDGVLGSGAEGYYASFRDVTKTYIAANTHFEIWYLIINQGKFDELPAAERTALEQAATAFEAKRWTNAEADQAANEKKLEQVGAKIVRPSAQELAAHAAKVRKVVWPQIIKDVGESFAKPILDKVAN
ncbi:MAG: TRAP transporter substrate-binding protein DctP [Burkholderiales bacterium]|nr:MAG: TRAP transporter substrate-binding protein DctP [Burkholderiales bacterium]